MEKKGRTINCTPHDIKVMKQPNYWQDPKVAEVDFIFKSYNGQDIRCTTSYSDTEPVVVDMGGADGINKHVVVTNAPMFDSLSNIPKFTDGNGKEAPLNESDTLIVSMPVGNLVASNPELLPCIVMGPNTGPNKTIQLNGKDFIMGAVRYPDDHPQKGQIMGCYDFVIYK